MSFVLFPWSIDFVVFRGGVGWGHYQNGHVYFVLCKKRVLGFTMVKKYTATPLRFFLKFLPPIVADEKGYRWVAVFFVTMVNLEGPLRVYVGSVKML